MDEMDALRQQLKEGFDRVVRQRVEDRAVAAQQRREDLELRQQQHEENIGRFEAQDERLETIEQEVKTTNGKVIRHEEQIRTLFERGKTSPTRSPGITKRDVQMFLSGGGALIAAWKFAEWAVPLLQQRHP